MKILIITMYYPPDTSIAAVRPFMFAKYLAAKGNDVTVLRSGELYCPPAAADTLEKPENVRVISYLGPDSTAERYERGEIDAESLRWRASPKHLAFLPESLRRPLKWTYRVLRRPFQKAQERMRIGNALKRMKQTIDGLNSESFDLVFATYGPLENAYAGQYAAQKLHCKWVLDFRDPIASRAMQTLPEFLYKKHLQRRLALSADACTAVSKGVAQAICRARDPKKVQVLYNGYEGTEQKPGQKPEATGRLTFCYTGALYEKRKDAFRSLLEALEVLIREGRIEQSALRFVYAGMQGPETEALFAEKGLEGILENRGYVGREEASRIQQASDVFVLLSWNTREEQGVLTGKFFEGIRAERPILAVVTGNLPQSELYELNEEYRYGFCYEDAQRNVQFDAFCDYIEGLYRQKRLKGSVEYTPVPALKSRFEYRTLADELEALMQELLAPDRS